MILESILKGKRPWYKTSLATDAYKMSMALGGRPEEEEAFYLSYRSGGAMFMPLNLEDIVDECIPDVADIDFKADEEWLVSKGFPVTQKILRTAVDSSNLKIVYAAPKGELVCPREPLLTLKGPQALMSWPESLLIGRVSYQMQVASAVKKAADSGSWEEFEARISKVTCERQKELTLEACRGAGLGDEDIEHLASLIQVDEQGYYDAVQANAKKLLATGVDVNRFFEVGLRAATCMEQHLIALKALKDLGFIRTSNVYGAYVLDMIPIGTLGHEGVTRWGGNDEVAFRKHLKVLPVLIMLLDTNDTLKVGLPTAFKLMQEFPDRNDGVRPDSGNLEDQFRVFEKGLKKYNIRPRPWVFEDGLDDVSVAFYENLREELEYPAEKTLFGLGGFFIDRPEFTGFRRGLISMIYKLSWTESYGPAMKFGNEEEKGDSGKQSIPGIPVLAVCDDNFETSPLRGDKDVMVCQEGNLPEGWRIYSKGDSNKRRFVRDRPVLDEITESIKSDCMANRQNIIDSYV